MGWTQMCWWNAERVNQQLREQNQMLEQVAGLATRALAKARIANSEQIGVVSSLFQWRNYRLGRRHQLSAWRIAAKAIERLNFAWWRRQSRGELRGFVELHDRSVLCRASEHWRVQQLKGVYRQFELRHAAAGGKRLAQLHEQQCQQNRTEAEWRFLQLRAVFHAMDVEQSGVAPEGTLVELGLAPAVRSKQHGWSWARHCQVLHSIAPWHPEVTEEVFVSFFGGALPLDPCHFDALITGFFEHLQTLTGDAGTLQPPPTPRDNPQLKLGTAAQDPQVVAYHPVSQLPLSSRVARPSSQKLNKLRRQISEMGGTLTVQPLKPPLWTRRMWACRIWFTNTVGRKQAKIERQRQLARASQHRNQVLRWWGFSVLQGAVAGAGVTERQKALMAKAVSSPTRTAMTVWRRTSWKGHRCRSGLAIYQASSRQIGRLLLQSAMQLWRLDTCIAVDFRNRIVCDRIVRAWNWEELGSQYVHWRSWRRRRKQLRCIGRTVLRHRIYMMQCRSFILWRNAVQVALRQQVVAMQLSNDSFRGEELEQAVGERERALFDLSQRLGASEDFCQHVQHKAQREAADLRRRLEDQERAYRDLERKFIDLEERANDREQLQRMLQDTRQDQNRASNPLQGSSSSNRAWDSMPTSGAASRSPLVGSLPVRAHTVRMQN